MLRLSWEVDSCSGREGGEEYRRNIGLRWIFSLDTGTRSGVLVGFIFAPLLFLDVVVDGGIEGDFFLELVIAECDDIDFVGKEEDG